MNRTNCTWILENQYFIEKWKFEVFKIEGKTGESESCFYDGHLNRKSPEFDLCWVLNCEECVFE